MRLLKQVREDPTQIDKALAACRVRWQPDPTDVVAQVVAFDNQLVRYWGGVKHGLNGKTLLPS